MEYDYHTMLYKIPKKDEYKDSEEYEYEESNEYEYEENNEYEYEESDEYEYDEDEDLSINTKNKVKIRILGENFCRNNKNKGKLIINNKKSELKEFINIENINKEQIKIKMVLNKNLYNKSHMFKDCKSLL